MEVEVGFWREVLEELGGGVVGRVWGGGDVGGVTGIYIMEVEKEVLEGVVYRL